MTDRPLELPASLIARRLFQACALMVLLGMAAHAVLWWAPPEFGKLRTIARLFDLNEERTVSTAYAVGQLLLAAGVAGLVAARCWRSGDPCRRPWAGLALLILLLALDEQAGLHERLTAPMRELLGSEEPLGLLYYAWVVPGAVLVLGVALVFAGFLLRLPPDTRRGMLLSGGVFVGGALGMELLGGRFVEAEGSRSVGLLVASTLEEGMELFGIALLVRTIARHAERHLGPITLSLGPAPRQALAEPSTADNVRAPAARAPRTGTAGPSRPTMAPLRRARRRR